jgi:hypothetical protein
MKIDLLSWGRFILMSVITLAFAAGILATLYYAFLFFHRASKKLN